MVAQTEHERKHAALVTRRTQLVDLITQEKNRLKQSWDADAKKSVEKILKQLEKELKAIKPPSPPTHDDFSELCLRKSWGFGG